MIAAILILCTGLQAGGQVDLVHKAYGVEDYANFGHRLAVLDDVDLDGTPDYAVSAPFEDRGGVLHVGSVRVYSGRTRALISELFGTQANEEIGDSLVRVHDVNGDGRGDYALRSGSSFTVQIVSAVDAVILHSIPRPPVVENFAYAICDIGDLDGDGKHELAIGDGQMLNQFGPEAGIVYLYSGATFMPVASVEGTQGHARLGEALAAAGDLNGDLIPDFFAGAPGHIRNGRGQAFAYSGADLSIIHSLQNLEFEGRFGASVDAGTDVDGDGVPDLLVGAPFHNSAIIRAGTATVFSGASGARIRILQADLQMTGFGETVRFGGDMDGDGRPEVLVQESNADPGTSSPDPRVVAFSGFDYEPLAQFRGDDPAANGYESTFATPGDLTGDGFGDVLVAYPREILGVPNLGAVYLFSFRPQFFLSGRELSSAAGGSLAAQVRFSAASAGHSYRILASLSGASPSTTIGGVEVPLVADAAFQCTLAGAYPPFASGMAGTLDAAGRAQASITPGPGALKPSLVGRIVHLAAVEGTGGIPLRSSVQQGFLIVP